MFCNCACHHSAVMGLNLGRIQYRAPVTNPEQMRVKLTGLEPNTYYRVFLSGVTRRGTGEYIFLDMKTTEPGGECDSGDVSV